MQYYNLFLGHQNQLRVLYCQSKPAAPKAKSTRHIPQAEDRILDAPELLDDYCKLKILTTNGGSVWYHQVHWFQSEPS